MNIRRSIVLPAACGAALLAAGCGDPLSPRSPTSPRPSFAAAGPSGGITLDQQNGSLAGTNTAVLLKGFNPTNPHRGDAIVATFFWVGSTNIITRVSDHLANSTQTPVGNTYNLVSYTTAGGISMATYVATNVQNFPDPYGVPGGPQDSILVVEADLSQPVSQGGVQIAAYSGVGSVAAVAGHASATGTGTGIVNFGPGPIAVGAGGLVHAVALTNGIFGYNPPQGFSEVGEGDNPAMKEDAEYFVSGGVATVSPQWMWFYDAGNYTWLASAVALNPPPQLVFTQQPATTLPLTTMAPVKVSAIDAFGNVIPSFTDAVTIAIGTNAGLVTPGTLSGTKTVTAVNGVATWSDLSIDQPGNGYTFVVTTPRAAGATSAPFDIGVF